MVLPTIFVFLKYPPYLNILDILIKRTQIPIFTPILNYFWVTQTFLWYMCHIACSIHIIYELFMFIPGYNICHYEANISKESDLKWWFVVYFLPLSLFIYSSNTHFLLNQGTPDFSKNLITIVRTTALTCFNKKITI